MNTYLEKIRNNEPNSFEIFVFIIIILSSLLIGIETEPNVYAKLYNYLHLIDLAILIIFIIEIAIKMVAQDGKPWLYFKDPWNVFDFVIIMVSFLPFVIFQGQFDTHTFIVLRIVRAFRIARLFSHIKHFHAIVKSLRESIPKIGYVLFLLIILFYLYAIIGHFLFGRYDPEHFGNLFSSLLTLFESMLGNWAGYLNPLFRGTGNLLVNSLESFKPSDYPFIVPIYFISFYLFGGLIVLNLFVGIIVSEFVDVKKHELNNSSNDEESEFIEILKDSLENGVIQDSSRKFIEKRRIKLGISEDTAKILEDTVINKIKYDPNETDYLDELNDAIEDGAIVDAPRKYLEKRRVKLGISNIRAKELESIVLERMKG